MKNLLKRYFSVMYLEKGNSGDVTFVINLQRIPRKLRDRYEYIFREAVKGPVTFINF